jgi:cation diffusion facilitator CzcD-associated flavoprotein CzcO
MYTLGYRFRPWPGAKAIADGPSILEYVRDTARAYDLDSRISFNTRVHKASWSSHDSQWTVEATTPEGARTLTCSFIYLCTGYYDYESGYTPRFEGIDDFKGEIIHPQKWPEHLHYRDKRVVVIGSGATAVTLVPAMANDASHVTMLQRSPTYIVNLPSRDKIAMMLKRALPERVAYFITRWKNVFISLGLYGLARTNPSFFKEIIAKEAKKKLGPDYDMRHFSPRYNPWDQRLCLIPDADLFNSIRDGKASVVTAGIERFTPDGIRLTSGEEIAADIIVTATGLNMKLMAGLDLVVDESPVDLSRTMTYRGMMYSDVPNLASALGYTNASWTLKCDLTGEYVCKLLNHMKTHGYASATPRRTDPSVTEEPALSFTSGYVQRALPSLPKQGSKRPWKLRQNYALDLLGVRLGSVRDGVIEFRR